jgi:hypothetical protein
MPDRVIRDELLRSHRYRTLTSDTVRMLFMHLLLCVDALGNGEATTTAVCDAIGRPVDDPTVSKWLAELADCDLIRVYVVDGKRYLHIPRFRQRLRYLKGKHPRPPKEVECREIRELLQKVRLQSDHSQTTVRQEEKRSEEKINIGSVEPVDNFAEMATVTHELASKLKTNGNSQWWRTAEGIAAKGRAIGVPARPGETLDAYKARLFDAIKATT